MTDGEMETFNRIREIVALRSKGGGITLKQLADASALARELGKEKGPDPERVEMLAHRLGLEVEEIRERGRDGTEKGG